MDTLDEAFLRELARVRDKLRQYQSLGPSGTFDAAWLKELVTQAETAWTTYNLGVMIQLYGELLKVGEDF